MNNMPPRLRKSCAEDPLYKKCLRQEALHDHVCKGHPFNHQIIEWEHALIYAGKQVQKKFAIVPLCWWAHSGPGLVKPINEWIAINRATDDEMLELSHKGGRDYFLHRAYLNRTYGEYKVGENSTKERDGMSNNNGINYGQLGEKKRVIQSDYWAS